jgi:hypothetical protein
MTIEVFGHVQALEHVGRDRVFVRIQVEASRMRAGSLGAAPTIEILASPAEVDSYRPGMAIHIQIRPNLYQSNATDADAQPDRAAAGLARQGEA